MVTTQSGTTLRAWLRMAPEIWASRVSLTVFMWAAATARRRRLSASGVTPSNPSGYSSAMKAVEMSPDTKRGWSITAAQNGRLWPMPSTSKLSSALRITSIAPSRVGAQEHSLAIIGS